MASHYDIRLQVGREIPAGLLTFVAQLAEAYAGGYLRVSYALEIPNIPAQALVELEHRLMEAGITFSTMQSETFADGAGI